MEESIYKHNYEYLSIEEAKAIVNGTFVQGTTNIGGELATKSDIGKLLDAVNKKLTSIVPSTEFDNEFICFFECEDIETFPDDLEHRWIEVSPIQFTFPADGGSVKITGSYGLTGTLGTRKKVGDIADTVTADANATPSTKSGSKTYYYNNDQSQRPTAEVSWTQPNKQEEFPDDKAHRWIRVQPESSQISVDGGTIHVTGSYGLTGTYGTEKKIGDITDTIVVESNSTQEPKSGSKTYHYNNNQSDTPTAKITWTQPGRAEEFPDEWTYVFEYNISDTNGGSSTGTSWSRQYYANGQEIKHADDLTLNGITSYRTKTGTFGTVKKENVQYSGQIGRPSGYNYSDKVITQNGRLAQQGSNKQLQWSYTQEANVKVWGISADPTSLHFEAAGGTQSVSVTTWYTWQTNDNNNQKFGQTTTEEQITVEANTSTQQKEWTKTITKNGKSVSISCIQDKVDATQLIVPKFSTDGNIWTTTPMVLSWEAENTNALTYYYRVEVVTKNASTGEIISTTNLDKIGYTIVNQKGDHFKASINGNKVTVRPIGANTSYTDTIKTILSITPLGKENDHEFFGQSTFIHQYKGIKVENADMVVFTFGWNDGKDLDNATYVNDHVVGNENKYAGYHGGAANSNVNRENIYLMFGGDNTGTGKEYTCIDFNALSKYIENHADDPSTINGKKLKESFIDSDGNFVITIDIYNNWYQTKLAESIELDYSIYNYTQKSIVPTINSKNDKTFAITGATIIKTNLDNAICYANFSESFRNVRLLYTKTAEFVYYLNSGQFYIKTNKDNVSLWNKGFSKKEEAKDYNLKGSNQISFKNDNINYSAQIDSINLPKNKTAQLQNYLYVKLHGQSSGYNLGLSIYFPEQEIRNNTTFPKIYSDNISTSDLINKVLTKIQDNENLKSNTYIKWFSGNTSIKETFDSDTPEYFNSTSLRSSDSIDLNIKIN